MSEATANNFEAPPPVTLILAAIPGVGHCHELRKPAQAETTTVSNTIEPTLSIRRLRQKLPDADLFDGLSEAEADQWASYLYSRPKPETRILSTRNHAIALYDPLANRKGFPAGRRWCVNVYTGCAFSCKYCYTVGYIKNAFQPRVKKGFRRRLEKDLEELRGRALHSAPIHISNSTDPLQPLEKVHRHTLFLVKALRANRDRFTTITMLTKNPEMLCAPEYMEVIQTLTGFQVEVTCLFFRDEARRFYEPGAPKIESRLEAIRRLRENDISVSLRIDPVFPRDPLPQGVFGESRLRDYGIVEGQTAGDIEQLVAFAAEVGCQRVIVSSLKLVVGRWGKSELLETYLALYRDANKGQPIKRGTAYRLPWSLYQHWIEEPIELAESLGIEMIYCKKNLFATL